MDFSQPSDWYVSTVQTASSFDKVSDELYSRLPRAKTWHEYDESRAYFVWPGLCRPPDFPRPTAGEPQSNMVNDDKKSTSSDIVSPDSEQNPIEDCTSNTNNKVSLIRPGESAKLELLPANITNGASLSKCFVVEDTGLVSYADGKEISDIFKHLSRATIARVSQVGCAAVHLAVTGCEYTVTGFRWGEKLIVSCGHFHRWRFEENQQGKLETLLADPSPCMFSQERLLVAQTEQVEKPFPGRARLKALDWVNDIAVWEVVETMYEKGEKFQVPNLDIDGQLVYSSALSFSVGYNGYPSADELQESWRKTVELMKKKQIDETVIESLKAGPEHTEANFRPYQRTVSFGGPIRAEERGDLGVNICCTGAPGRSGAMIGVITRDEKIKIVGMFKGVVVDQGPMQHNQMIWFKPELMAWLKKVSVAGMYQEKLQDTSLRRLLFPGILFPDPTSVALIGSGLRSEM